MLKLDQWRKRETGWCGCRTCAKLVSNISFLMIWNVHVVIFCIPSHTSYPTRVMPRSRLHRIYKVKRVLIMLYHSLILQQDFWLLILPLSTYRETIICIVHMKHMVAWVSYKWTVIIFPHPRGNAYVWGSDCLIGLNELNLFRVNRVYPFQWTTMAKIFGGKLPQIDVASGGILCYAIITVLIVVKRSARTFGTAFCECFSCSWRKIWTAYMDQFCASWFT